MKVKVLFFLIIAGFLNLSACKDKGRDYIGRWMGMDWNGTPEYIEIAKSGETFIVKLSEGGDVKMLATLENGRLSDLNGTYVAVVDESSNKLIVTGSPLDKTIPTTTVIEYVRFSNQKRDRCACWLKLYAAYHKEDCINVFSEFYRSRGNPRTISAEEVINHIRLEDAGYEGRGDTFYLLKDFCVNASEDSTESNSHLVAFVWPNLIGMNQVYVTKEDYLNYVKPYEDLEMKLGKSASVNYFFY